MNGADGLIDCLYKRDGIYGGLDSMVEKTLKGPWEYCDLYT